MTTFSATKSFADILEIDQSHKLIRIKDYKNNTYKTFRYRDLDDVELIESSKEDVFSELGIFVISDYFIGGALGFLGSLALIDLLQPSYMKAIYIEIYFKHERYIIPVHRGKLVSGSHKHQLILQKVDPIIDELNAILDLDLP